LIAGALVVLAGIASRTPNGSHHPHALAGGVEWSMTQTLPWTPWAAREETEEIDAAAGSMGALPSSVSASARGGGDESSRHTAPRLQPCGGYRDVPAMLAAAPAPEVSP
jgi:hypothetical protein